jgi:hypothetical protein
MKQRTVLFSLLTLLGCAFLLFTGCPVDGTDITGYTLARAVISDPPPVFVEELVLEIGDPPVYYDLATGQKVTTGAWDFGVEYQSDATGSGLVFFYTNSGASATSVGGYGGVWFTNKTDFDTVQFSDRVTDFSGVYAEYAPYVTDFTRYAMGMSVKEYSAAMNMMTYFGFSGGVGTYADPFQVNPYTPPIEDYKFYNFDKRAAYTDIGNMPPELAPTGQVYIIQHRDGRAYSKLQVSEFSLDPTDLFYTIELTFTEVE